MDIEQRIENALACLGDAPDVVAERLLAEGCYGDSDCHTCPVTRLVEKIVGDSGINKYYTSTTTNRAVVTVWVLNLGRKYITLLPIPVAKFIQRHDRGRYPALISTPTPTEF